jgi:hypothetical protein
METPRYVMQDECVQPFQDALIKFIGQHALTHESLDQRHFQAIVDIFYSTRTNGEKLLHITAKLQEADEYVYGVIKETLGFGRHRETALSYERLYQHLLSNFSTAIRGESSLLAKVKSFLGRSPDTRFRIEESRMIRMSDRPSPTESDEPLAREGFEDRPRDFSLAITTLYQLIAHHRFQGGGTLNTHTFELIRKCVSEDILATGSLSPRSILDIQVRLHSALTDSVNPFRTEATTAFYRTLEDELFRTAHSFAEISGPYETYLAALRAEEERIARIQAEAMSMAHFI